MYLCFEADDKRIAIRESSLIMMDENGFTIQSTVGARGGSGQLFFRLSSYQGCIQNFAQALGWVRRAQQKAKPSPGRLPDNPGF